jgi:hypothetical protein
MKKLLWGLTACFLLVSAISLEAGEKRYQIRLTSASGDVFGKPVSFQEIVPTPEPYDAGGLPAPPAPLPLDAPGGLQPVPEPYTIQPVPEGGIEYQTVELYHRVKYEDRDNVHPRAVKKIVAVKDPSATGRVCGNCAPPCVYVIICVPPTDRFEYDVKRSDHSKVEYDYGDYEIEITSNDGVVCVNYDD